MAKKQKNEEVVIETPPVVEQPKIKKEVKPTNTWEIKERKYILKGQAPLCYILKGSNIYWFDEEKGYERELKITDNQRSPFVDEFKGQAKLSHIMFMDGMLIVPKEKQTLQKLLSLYHPDKDKVYFEYNAIQEATDEVEDLELEIEALMAAKSIDIDMAEAIMRVEIGSEVSNMSSKELKRDLLLYAKKNPAVFLELLNDDNVVLRNFGIRATEMGLLILSQDQRTFSWGSNGRKLMNVPFDEHPYSALASWFKTDEGMEIYKTIEKQLK